MKIFAGGDVQWWGGTASETQESPGSRWRIRGCVGPRRPRVGRSAARRARQTGRTEHGWGWILVSITCYYLKLPKRSLFSVKNFSLPKLYFDLKKNRLKAHLFILSIDRFTVWSIKYSILSFKFFRFFCLYFY